MGPDLSDGIIIEIDRDKGIIYIQDIFYDGMIVRGDIANCQKGETFIVGEQVVYPLLYNEHPTAAGIYKQSMFSNPAAQQQTRQSKTGSLYNKWLTNSYINDSKSRTIPKWWIVLFLLLGMLWGILKR